MRPHVFTHHVRTLFITCASCVVAGGMSSAEGVVEVGGNEINERDVFYAPFTCESEPAFKIETSNQIQ